MRHHFGDSLDRDGGHWSMTENLARYGQAIDGVPAGADVKAATIGRDTGDWERVFTFPDLVELTLHEPSPAQIDALARSPRLRRLRITHARPRQFDALAALTDIEELVLEYVSGFDDLSPLRSLPRLRALHLENLRRVHDFSGLAGIASLRYLAIHGTLDWKQPIDDFAFVRGTPGLEVLRLWQIRCGASFPATLPLVDLRHLRQLRVHASYLPAAELALLEEGLDGVEGADWGPFAVRARSRVPMPTDDPRHQQTDAELRAAHPEVWITSPGTREIDNPEDRWYEFAGTGSGQAKVGSPAGERRCREFADHYASLRQQARALLDRRSSD